MSSPQSNGSPGFPRSGHLAVLSLVYAGLVIYGSLVPFHFRPIPLEQALERFWQIPYLHLGIGSRSDLVANLLLFIPLAWLLLAALTVDRRWFWRLLAVCFVLPLCGFFAVLIEFTQLMFPGRTTSINDMLAETSGAAVGSLLWLAVGQRSIDWMRVRWTAIGRQGLAAHLLTGYLVFLVLVHVMPLDLTISPVELFHKYREGRVSVVPFSGYSTPQTAVLKVLTQLLYFAPLGCLLSYRNSSEKPRLNRWFLVLLQGAGSAGICELAQLFVFTRHSDITDVILGACAVLFGWWLGALRLDWQTLLRKPLGNSAALLVWVGVAVLFEWWPFEFLTDFEQISQRAARVSWVPFADYYAGTDYNAFNQVLDKSLLFLPLGALLALGVFRAPGAWGTWGAVLLGLLTSLVLEVGQLAQPGRFASLTDVLVETTGVLLGAVLVQRVCRLPRQPKS